MPKKLLSPANKKLFLAKKFSKLFFALVACLTLLAQGNVCYAQYWGLGSMGYYGMYGVSSVLWPLMYFMNPYRSSSLYGYNYLNRTAANNNTSSYQNTPNNNSVPVWNQTYQQPTSNQPFSDPNDVFNSRSSVAANTPGLVSSSNGQSASSPPLAPDRRSSDSTSANQIAEQIKQNPSSTAGQNASIDGFFQTVMVRYHGDIMHAISKPDMRSWAESISLVDVGQVLPTNLSKPRKSEISILLKDSSLNAHKKLYVLHLLIE